MKKAFVTYKDFGAVGDGKANDFFAIQAAHTYANENGLPVKADPSAMYLIGNTEKNGIASSIIIKTDTDFCGASFIFDDTDIHYEPGEKKCYNTYPFSISGDYEHITLSEEICKRLSENGGVKDGSLKKIDTRLGYPAMLIVRCDDERVFIRYGGNQNSGDPKQELILVDENGNVDKSTPFLFDYDKFTSITAIRTDEKPITVENGKFVTRASRVNVTKNVYLRRGISLQRSNTVIRNLTHEITGEIPKYAVVDENSNVLTGFKFDKDSGKVYSPDGTEISDGSAKPFFGQAYAGFISFGYCNNVLIEHSTFQGRVYYLQGTYDILGHLANNVTFKKCIQSNFLANDTPSLPLYPAMGKWWGIAGTNFCKNVTYDSCRLTRFDAHEGIVNGKIINSEIAALRLTGGGNMHIEGTKFYNFMSSLVSLREDYGSTWRGTITIKNCEVLDTGKNSKLKNIVHSASSNHWFGYPTYFPNIVIDNLKIENPQKEINLACDYKSNPNSPYYYRGVSDPAISVSGGICTDGKINENVYTPPKFIKVINNEQNGYKITLIDCNFFKDTQIEGAAKK